MSEYNLAHYNVQSKYFWQAYFDRLAAYTHVPFGATVSSVKLYPCGRLDIQTTNSQEVIRFLKTRFVILEEKNKIIIPSSVKGIKGIAKGLWLYIPQIFDPKENSLIIDSYIHFFYERSYPKQFTTWFFKYLNKIIDLSEIIRKAGVQKVNFLDEGVQFVWPIYFMSRETPEILNSDSHGIVFSRNEVTKQETILVPYMFAWAALSGTCWSGNIKSLFHNVEAFKHIKDTFEDLDPEQYNYCEDRIRTVFSQM